LTEHTGNASLGIYTTESYTGIMNGNRILQVLSGDIVSSEFRLVADGMVPILRTETSVAYDLLIPTYSLSTTSDSTTYSSHIDSDLIVPENSESTVNSSEYIKIVVGTDTYFVETFSLRNTTYGIAPIIGNAIFINYDIVPNNSRLYSAGYLAVNWGDSTRYIPVYQE
jgi:hypothetical protein